MRGFMRALCVPTSADGKLRGDIEQTNSHDRLCSPVTRICLFPFGEASLPQTAS